MNSDGPDVTFVQFVEVDTTGHNSEFSPDCSEYLAAIQGVNVLVGRLMEVVEDRRFKTNAWLRKS